MKLYQNYIFDLYGTLVDIRTDERQRSLWNKISLFFGYHGADYMPEELLAAYQSIVSAKEKEKQIEDVDSPRYAHESYPEISIEEVFRELYTAKGVEPAGELVLHTGQMFRIFSTQHIRLYAGAKELLHALKEKKRGIYLLSNAQRIFTEYELRYLQIYDYFDGILISSDYGVKKPDEEFFHLLIDKYGIKPKKSLMIGNDLECDIAGAKRLGMDTFYIRSAISPDLEKPINADYFMTRVNLESLRKQLLLEQDMAQTTKNHR